MVTPLGLEHCKSRSEALSAIQGGYWDFCLRKFKDLFEEVRATFFSSLSFDAELEEVLANQITNLLFEEDIGPVYNECRRFLRERTEELLDLDVNWVWQKDKKDEYYADPESVLSRLIKRYGAEDRARWDSIQTIYRTQDEHRQTRLAIWWTTQMFRIFGPRTDKADKYEITLSEDYDSYPEWEDHSLRFEDVENWLPQKLLQPKYPPEQVATFWRQIDITFQFSDYLQTLLLRKIMGRVEDDSTKLKELYDHAAFRWGHLVLQTALRGGITELEWHGHTPPGGHLVIRQLFSPDHVELPSVARNKWGNPVWPKVKYRFTQLFEIGMTSEIFSRDRTFCQALKSQVGQAIRMNRVRLKELMDAWRFLFFHICHPYGGESQIEFLDK
jgi:hypothetical protein